MTGLEHLRDELRDDPNLARLVAAQPVTGGVFDELAARAPRSSGRAGDYALVLESILEGYLMHYRRPRLFDPADDGARLLSGDFLYAWGLARLAVVGDAMAVRELAELVSTCAQAELGDVGVEEVADIWCASAVVVLCGAGGREEAIDRARGRLGAGAWAAAADLSIAAEAICEQAGMSGELAALRRSLRAALEA